MNFFKCKDGGKMSFVTWTGVHLLNYVILVV